MVKLELDIPDEFYEEEVRCGYTVTMEMKKIWAVELDLLNKFMKVCDANKIKYSVCGGTLLGAVRHKGFIPWDDDIDVMMDADNYQKLCSLPKDTFGYPYFFQTEETDPGSLRGHAQLRNSETTGILKSEYVKGFKINQGIFIDIFPYYNVPDDEKECDRYLMHMRNLKIYSSLFALFTTHTWYRPHNFFKRCVQALLSSFLKPVFGYFNPFYKKLITDASRYSDLETERFCWVTFNANRKYVFRYVDYSHEIFLPFEMLNVPVPAGYDVILTGQYGNWHEFIVGTSLHGGVVFDTDKSYIEYIGQKKEILENL